MGLLRDADGGRASRLGVTARLAGLLLLGSLLAGCPAATRLAFARQALESCEARNGTDYQACASERAEVSKAERAAR